MTGAPSIYSKWARQTAEHFIKVADYPSLPAYLPGDLSRQRACYVTIIENPGRKVRAMHGQALPQQPTLAHEIIANTIAALKQNPARPIRRGDLNQIIFSVALLGPLQRISDLQHLNPERLGLYIRSDRGKAALLLPQRTGIETPNDQLACALREAGIVPHMESFTIYRFEVEYDDG